MTSGRTEPKLAGVVRLDRQGSHFSLTVDGEEFPYYLADRPITVEVSDRAGFSVIMLPLIADRLEIIDSLDNPIGD